MSCLRLCASCAIFLMMSLVAAPAAAYPNMLTASGLRLGAPRPAPPGHRIGDTLALSHDGRTCRAYDPATQTLDDAIKMTLSLPSDQPASPPRVFSTPDARSAIVAWVTRGRIRWLPVTCDPATQLTTPREVPLPESWPDAIYEGPSAGALSPDGTLTLALGAGLIDLDTSSGAITPLANFNHTSPIAAPEDWRVRFIPEAERHLLYSFGVRHALYTRAGDLWVLLQRDGTTTMNLWLLRRRAGQSSWELLRQEDASDPSSLLLLPFKYRNLVMRYIPAHDIVWFITSSFAQSTEMGVSLISLVVDPNKKRPFERLPQPIWRYHSGWPALFDGADTPWTIASPREFAQTTYAPILFDLPDADVDLDGLTRAQEDALGTSDFTHDSDEDGAPDSLEHWLQSDPLDPADPPPLTPPALQQLAFSTRLMDWSLFGDGNLIQHFIPGAYCEGNPALPRSCPSFTNRCVYSGHICQGVDARRVGPDDVPGRYGHLSFLLGRYDTWIRYADGAWLLQRADGTSQRLDGLDEAADINWSILAAISEEDLWLWRSDQAILHWRAGKIVTRANAAGVTPLGYSRALGTFLVSSILPGEELGFKPDRYIFAVDGEAPRGLRLLGSARLWAMSAAGWLKPVGDTPLDVLGSVDGPGAQSVSIDPWGREVMRLDRPASPAFFHDTFRNGATAQHSIAFMGAPAEFGAGDCPWWADPLVCGNPAANNLPIVRFVPLYGELTPISPRLMPGDIAFAAGDELWLHREQGGVHSWLPRARWVELATPAARADLIAERAAAKITHLAFAPDAERLCAVMSDGRLFEWTLREGLPVQLDLLRAEGVKACAYEAGGQRLIATDRAVEREGAPPLALDGERTTLGLQRSGDTLLVHRMDVYTGPLVQCVPLAPGGRSGERASVAALTVDGGVVSWVEAINTRDQQPPISTRGHGWVASLDDLCANAQPREHLAVGEDNAHPEQLWHKLHRLGAMLDPGDTLKVVHGVMARRPDGVLLMSSIEPRTRVRGTGSFGGEYIYAYPHRVTPSYEPLPGAMPIAAHDGLRRGQARIIPIHNTLINITAMATAPGEVAADYGLSSKYDCWEGGCQRVASPVKPPSPPAPEPEPEPAPEPPEDEAPASCLCAHSSTPPRGPSALWSVAVLLALAWRRRGD